MIAQSNRSPFAVVAKFPLAGEALVPWAIAVESKEFAVATPEYSAMVNFKLSMMVSETVTAFGPATIFSA